jgi:hypothetical protein
MKLLTPRYFLVTLLVLIFANPVLAQSNQELTRAEVYKLQKLVNLLLANQPARQAQLKDAIRPLDGVQTKARSRVDLLFNEGSVLQVGANSGFRFKPGLRKMQLKNGQTVAETLFELQDGTVVAITPPGSAGTTVEIPGSGKVESLVAVLPPPPNAPTNEPINAKVRSGVFTVTHDKINNITSVANLGIGEVKVFNENGTQFKILQGGETVNIKNGVLGDVKTFDLGRFYTTTKLGAGLGPGQERLLINESPQVQETFRAVRKDTIAAWKVQQKWIEGLCTLNGRGVASTLSSNCINTNSDDPLRTFEDRRGVGIPPRRQPPTPQPPTTQPPTPQPPTTQPPTTQPPGTVPGVIR